MCVTMPETPVAEVPDVRAEKGFALHIFPEGPRCVVHAAGELDLASCEQLFVATTAGSHPSMVIDLDGVTFMDCSGYGSLVASRRAIERAGRALTIRGHHGQPAHLIELIAAMERVEATPE